MVRNAFFSQAKLLKITLMEEVLTDLPSNAEAFSLPLACTLLTTLNLHAPGWHSRR